MSKIITLTDEHKKQLLIDFTKALELTKVADGKLNFVKSFDNIDEKTTLYYTANAWVKMVAIVQEFTDEVAWHGLAKRSDDPEGYIIYDILVYPQEVSGASVVTDQEKYQTWLYSHPDEVFNNIRAQGHSHVNMGCTPSTTDITHQGKILEQLDDTMFYVFTIVNKKYEINTKIYDLAKNVLYESKDITVRIFDEGIGITEFITQSKEMVTRRVYTAPAYQGGYQNYRGYQGYQGYNPVAQIAPATVAAAAAEQVANPATGKAITNIADKPKTKANSSQCVNSSDEDDDYTDYMNKFRRGWYDS